MVTDYGDGGDDVSRPSNLPKSVTTMLRYSKQVSERTAPLRTTPFSNVRRPQSVASPTRLQPQKVLPVRPHTSSLMFRPSSTAQTRLGSAKSVDLNRPFTPNTRGFFVGRPHSGHFQTSYSGRPASLRRTDTLKGEENMDDEENYSAALSARILVPTDIPLKPSTIPNQSLAVLTPQSIVSGVRKTSLRKSWEELVMGRKNVPMCDFFNVSTYFDENSLIKRPITVTDVGDYSSLPWKPDEVRETGLDKSKTMHAQKLQRPKWRAFEGQFIDMGKVVVGCVQCYRMEVRNNAFLQTKFLISAMEIPFCALEFSQKPVAPGLTRRVDVTLYPEEEHIGEWLGWIRIRSDLSGTEYTEVPIYICILPEDAPRGAMPPVRTHDYVPVQYP